MTNYQHQDRQTIDWTDNLTNNRLTRTIDLSKGTNQLIQLLQSITWQFNWPIRSISLWLWRWPLFRSSKRKSLSSTVLFRTSLTWTITLDKLLISLVIAPLLAAWVACSPVSFSILRSQLDPMLGAMLWTQSKWTCWLPGLFIMLLSCSSKL